MSLFLLFVVALAVGLALRLLSDREEEEDRVGEEDAEDEEEAAEEGEEVH